MVLYIVIVCLYPSQESAFLYYSLTSSVHKSEGFLADVCESISLLHYCIIDSIYNLRTPVGYCMYGIYAREGIW